MKTCSKCKEEKEIEEFYLDKKCKDGFKNRCKTCLNSINKIWNQNNVDKLKEYQKEYRKDYYKNNVNKRKEYYNNNIEKIKTKRKEYYKNNKEATLLTNNTYRNKRKQSDPLFKLSVSLRSMISTTIKKNGYKKLSKTELILGCSFDFLKQHLESQFQHWMSWDNYGLYNGEFNYGWDIDHIVPLSSALNENDLLKLNHYSNLKPFCSYNNRYIKKDKII
jgi:hypothetical protein